MRPVLLLAAGLGVFAAGQTQTHQRKPYQYYPNVPGEVIFENDRLVVQRYVVNPGQWEGVHSHPGNQLYVHIRGGQWTVRRGQQKETSIAKDGSVGWMEAVAMSEDHESGNTGDTPIEFLWITLK